MFFYYHNIYATAASNAAQAIHQSLLRNDCYAMLLASPILRWSFSMRENFPAQDAVQRILQQWDQQRPDLDVSAMAILGRLARAQLLAQKQVNQVLAGFALSCWEFDVLASLRRAGAPYRLSPTALFSSLMLSSGTMTRQLQQLEARGLILRLSNPHDARSMLVELSATGLQLIDQAIAAHVQNQHQILAGLAESDWQALDLSLQKLLGLFEEKYGEKPEQQ